MRIQWCLLALLVVPALGLAQETITFAEAARRTLADRPELKTYAYRFEANAAQRDQAALRPGYTLGVDLENALGTGNASGIHAAELTVSLSRLWEMGGKRDARITVAERNAETLTAERDIVAADVVAETARQFVALAAAQQRVADAQEAVQQARRSLDLTQKRHAAAQAPQTEVLGSRLLLGETELALENAHRATRSAQQLLGAQWGAPGSAPVATLDVYALPEPRPIEQLLAQLDDTPDLRRYASDTRLAEAELALARTQARADLTFSAGVRRLEELDDQALVFGFSMPLGTASRAQPAIRERTALLAQVDAERATTRLRLETLLRRQVLTLESARATEQAIRERQLQPAGDLIEQTRRGFGIGRFPWRDLAQAERQLLDLKRQRLEAASAYHLTRVEIERLTGLMPVAGDQPESAP